MPAKLTPEKIDQMAEGFVGVGGHRDVPTFAFDADLQLKPLKGIEIRLDELPPRRPAVNRKPSVAMPESTLPSPVREMLGV